MASRLLSRYPFILSAKQSVATLLTRSFSYSTTTAPASSSYLALGQFSFLSRFRPLAAVAAGYVHTSPPIVGESRAFSTRQTQSSLNDSSPNWSNRPPKETILLDGCDFEHWLVVMEKPDESMTRDDIINWYIQTLSAVVGSEEESRMKIYSVSTKHYFAFGALVSEELSYKLKELPKVRWVLPDSYLDVKNKDYGGEPFINGQAVPYDPKYHEEWVRNNQKAMERNRRNDRPRNSDRSRNFERRRQNMQYQGPPMPNQGPPMPNQGPPPLQHQGPPPMPNQGPPPMQHQGPPPMPNQGPPPMQHQGPPPMPNQGPPPMQNQGPPMYNQRPPMQNQGPPMQNPATNMGTPAPGMGGPGPQNNMGGLNMGGPAQYSRTTPNNIGGPPNAGWGSSAPNNNMGNNFQNSGGMQHQNSPPLGPGPNYQPYPSNMGGPPAGDPYQQRDMPGRDMPPPPPPNYR